MSAATVIRPRAVFLAQARAFWLGLTGFTRVCTYTETDYLFGIPWRVHYLQIEMENGKVLYRSTSIPSDTRARQVALIKLLMDQHRRRRNGR